jgi:hypothetical protein
MPEEPEVETKDLQEAIDELEEERAEVKAEAKRESWTKYVGLSTAILAVFAAIGSLQAGSLVNEAQIHQLRSSDKWNEYQASKEKGHIYTVAINQMIDAGVVATAKPPKLSASKPKAGSHKEGAGPVKRTWKKMTPDGRIAQYEGEITKEDAKQVGLGKEAADLSEESEKELGNHEQFAYSVALIQVAIALGAVSALAKVKSIWYLSMACGIAGIFYFSLGFRTIKHSVESPRPAEQTSTPSPVSPAAP